MFETPSESTTTPKEGGLVLTLKGSLISHPSTMHGTYGAGGVHRVLRESRFSHDTQEIAYLAPLGACNHATRDCVWEKFFKEKRIHSFFLKDLLP